MNDLIRPHDPFSGHQDPVPADDTTEPEKVQETPPPPPTPAKKPAAAKPARKPAVRRGRRPRRVPSEAEVAEAASRVRK